MFTSEPSLAQRIERMIDGVPIVDIHSRIDAQSPAAPDLAALLAEPPLLLALRGVGYSGQPTDTARSVEERVAEVLPSLRLVRNTAAGWCFHRILRDLHDFTDPELTPANLPPLLDRVAQAAADPAWPAFVLQKRAKLAQIITGLSASAASPAAAPLVESGLIAYRLDLAATDPGDADSDTVRHAVFEQLDNQIEAPVRFASLVDALEPSHAVHDAILRWHHFHGAPLQVTSAVPEAILRAMSRYSGVRLGFLPNLDATEEAINRLTSGHPSLALGSLSTPTLAPSHLEARVLNWVERLSTSRLMGFASGATTAEWTYAAYILTRRATAAALSRAVVGGYFEEDEIPPLCRGIFHDSPIAWHRLE